MLPDIQSNLMGSTGSLENILCRQAVSQLMKFRSAETKFSGFLPERLSSQRTDNRFRFEESLPLPRFTEHASFAHLDRFRPEGCFDSEPFDL